MGVGFLLGGRFPLQLFFYYKKLELNTDDMQNSNAAKKEKTQECQILTASRHIAVLPCELISFQNMAPGLAVIVRIPAAHEREKLFVLSDVKGVWGDLKVGSL